MWNVLDTGQVTPHTKRHPPTKGSTFGIYCQLTRGSHVLVWYSVSFLVKDQQSVWTCPHTRSTCVPSRASLTIKPPLQEKRAIKTKKIDSQSVVTVCDTQRPRWNLSHSPTVVGAEQPPPLQLFSLTVKGHWLDCRAASDTGIRLLDHSHSSSLKALIHTRGGRLDIPTSTATSLPSRSQHSQALEEG